MSRMWIVRKGKHFWGKTKTVYASSDYNDCLRWINENIKKHEHMYVDEVERITSRDTQEILENAGLRGGHHER